MTPRFRCPSRQLFVLTVVSLVGTTSLAESQTSKDAEPADALSEASTVSSRQVRATSTEILRSASELAQTAVSLSSQVSVPSEDESVGSEIWVQKISLVAKAFRSQLAENSGHLAALEEALGATSVEQSPPLTKARPEPDLVQPEEMEQGTTSRDDLAVALAIAKKAVDIETDARKAEVERRIAAEAEADALAEEMVAADERIAALQNAQEALEVQSAEAQTELDQTHKKLSNVEREYVVLESSFEDCRQGFENCNREKATLDPSNLSGKLKTAEEQLADLLTVREDLSAQVQDATNTAELCAAILSRSDDRLGPALTEIERLEAALLAEQRKNEALTAKLAVER